MKQLSTPWHTENPPQNWATPRALFDELSRRYGPFSVDAAAEANNTKVEACFFTEAEDALHPRLDWTDGTGPSTVWCNPPYDNIGAWISKARQQIAKGVCRRVVFLIPARTSTDWFHDQVLPFGRVEYLRGRVSFDPPPGVERSSAFEHSMVVVFERACCPAELK